MPKKEVLETYNVLQFHELACALKDGNVLRFDEVIQKHENFFIQYGNYLIVEKLKIIGYRNLFKKVNFVVFFYQKDFYFKMFYFFKVYLIAQTHQLDLQLFLTALHFVGESDITMDEVHCIIANLIYDGKIKGYISHQHSKLVVSKQNPFPSLNTAM